MKKKTSLLLALMLAALMLMTAGCGGPASEEAQTQTVTGMGGVEVTLPKEVKTIVDTWSAATDNLFNLGAGELLVSDIPLLCPIGANGFSLESLICRIIPRPPLRSFWS